MKHKTSEPSESGFWDSRRVLLTRKWGSPQRFAKPKGPAKPSDRLKCPLRGPTQSFDKEKQADVTAVAAQYAYYKA